MSQSTRKLVTFGNSHYCEKARWALDWHGVAYDEINWPPGVHLLLAKRCGAKGSSLPILLDGRTVVQGSCAIIDWADQQTQDPARRLTLADARAIEQRADDVIGVHVRRLAYAELLPRYPELVKPALFGKTSGLQRFAGNMMWPLSRRIMLRMHSITPEPRQRADRFWSRSSTGSTACSPTTAAISPETASLEPTSPWPAYWLSLRGLARCRHTMTCSFPTLSSPTANAGAIGRQCVGSSRSIRPIAVLSLLQGDRILLHAESGNWRKA